MAQAESEHIHPPPFRNSDCKLVQQVTALGGEAPVYSFEKWPSAAQCWKDRAEWFVSHHHEMSIEERRRRLYDLDLYSGAPMVGRRRS